MSTDAQRGHFKRPTETTVADLTRKHFGCWVDVPVRGAGGYLYAIRDDFNDGYPSRTLVLVEDSGAADEQEFTDSNPAGYPKTMGTVCTVAEDPGPCAGQLDLAEAASAGQAPSPTAEVLIELLHERRRQTAKHGDQSHLPDGTGPDLILRDLPVHTGAARADHLERWARERTKAASQNEGGDGSITFEHILTEEWGEAIAEADPARLRAELIQVAAVAVQWIEAIDLRGGPQTASDRALARLREQLGDNSRVAQDIRDGRLPLRQPDGTWR